MRARSPVTAQASQSPEGDTTPSRGQTARDVARETALVRDMLAGDEDAMEAFADRYFAGLYRFALARLGGRSDLARDIVQTTVCKALAKLEGYRGEAPLFAWLCACCRNEIAMHFRKIRHRPHLVELDESAPRTAVPHRSDPDESPDRVLLDKERARRVHEALDHLPPDYARALEWKYLDRLSVREISGRLRRSAKATESLLSRARNAFRETYEHLAGSRTGSRGGEVSEDFRPASQGGEP